MYKSLVIKEVIFVYVSFAVAFLMFERFGGGAGGTGKMGLHFFLLFAKGLCKLVRVV